MSARFAGRVALVTGASRGIGRAIAARLAAEGARVVVTARKPDSLAATVDELGGPATALGITGRADDPEYTHAAVTTAIEYFGRLDVLVSNVGINPAFGPLEGVDLAAVRKIFEVNVLAALTWARTAHEAWLGEHGGTIVNVASAAGLRPSAGLGAYGASKAALAYLTGQLALELAPGIRVNAVLPAVVRTAFAAPLYAEEETTAARYPLGRFGTPEDVASAVAFLASDEAAWITGHLLVVDGGLMVTGGV
ncbi:SDR family oxidoreductase [Acrocarpospora macrocephala]|uniref:SDR family oxidoreductase n=1 Tax=Acrocarpospora macrocephala TaxID=150177 RepID=UPI0012D35D0C|nr:SDR family oxidoreductase [Acrocarpospora macrocephala]